MIGGLKPYPEYRESGVPWLGTYPLHWSQQSLWTLSTLRQDRNPRNLPLLSVFLDRGVIRYEDGGGQVHAPSLDLSKYQVVNPGDFVLNNQQAWRGSVGVSNHHGIISPAYLVLGLSGLLNSVFANYLFRCPRMVDQFVAASKGVGDIQRQIYWPYLRTVQVPLPPLDEQTAIVRFLDHANRSLDRIIRSKKRLIALLNEQKQSIIDCAVTRGLDPSVRLKRSGIPWLGEIPEHWDVRRASWLFDERIERGRPGLPILIVSLRTGVTTGADAGGGRPRRLIQELTSYKLAKEGDIAYNTMRMWQGAVGVVRTTGLVSPAYVVARPRNGALSSFFELVFRTDRCKGETNRLSHGIVSDRNRLYWDQFKRIYLPFPAFDEQERIVLRLERALEPLNIATSRALGEIDLIREYRARLIADVVTGQLDVRDAARRLPDEAEQPEGAVQVEAEEDSEELLEVVETNE